MGTDWVKKVGRVNTTILVAAASTLLSVLICFIGFKLAGKPLTAFGMSLAVITPLLVAPTVSWYLVGLLIKIHDLSELANSLATYDLLTGVMNRGPFLTSAESVFQLQLRSQTPLTVVFIDLDFFKSINDNYGHAAGDEVLRTVGKTLKESKRKSDLVARFGGEEFVLLLPKTDAEGAFRFTGLLQTAFSNNVVSFGNQTIRCTASFGIAVLDREADSGLEMLIKRADEALYQAKQSGRNQVVFAGGNGFETITPD
jgi:diguanylate cyclase (GGDEF)-like protein